MQRRFRFVRDYKCEFGTLEAGKTIDVVNGTIYYDNGLVEPWWAKYLEDLIRKEMEKPYYLKEVIIPYNKV